MSGLTQAHDRYRVALDSLADAGAGLDPDYTTLLLVTLPEPTPVHEAAELQADLERADIRPTAWVANQTLTATGTRDPIFAERARHERRWLADILDRHDQLAVVPWQPNAPTGADALAALVTDAPGVAVGDYR